MRLTPRSCHYPLVFDRSSLDALYLAAGGSAWEALRHDRMLTVEQATGVLRQLVVGLLAR